MKKKLFFILPFFMALFILVSCGSNNTANNAMNNENLNDNKNDILEIDNLKSINDEIKEGYIEGTILVKYNGEFDESLISNINYQNVKPLYRGSKWQKITLNDDSDTIDSYRILSDSKMFEKVELDYQMKSMGEIESYDVEGASVYINNSQNDIYDKFGIFDAWKYEKKHGLEIGGSKDVVVAVIDTGVDYNHIDLRSNIWINSGEIPNNGLDDDNNGYIDDYRGWDFVFNNNDPMDDNGHGTHVAGIIAADNNLYGTTGIAFNCKVMCIKAGNSSGYFTNSNIAEAIQYAYMNGASVINMSFGGGLRSYAMEEALENAHSECVLVAAAGNDTFCNEADHVEKHDVGFSYPAALSYVIGVMSCDKTGSYSSAFSNYDHVPNNNCEYDVYACGEGITSTFPNNKYAVMSGTSMATPMISGFAAILRSHYKDRDIYSNKYIQSKIINTNDAQLFIPRVQEIDLEHSYSNLYLALTNEPKPQMYLKSYYFFDNVEYSIKNNGNGVIEAGETIRLALEIGNRGGVASNISCSINTFRNKDMNIDDSMINFTNNNVEIDDIGTYSYRDFGKILNENGKIIGTNKYFEFVIEEDCPNDYLCKLNIVFNYKNGIENDNSIYETECGATINISNAISLGGTISEDTVFEGNRLYIIDKDFIINEGVNVTFEEGSVIQFYSGTTQEYLDNLKSTPKFIAKGNCVFNGTNENPISIGISTAFPGYSIYLQGNLVFNYCNMEEIMFNYSSSLIEFNHCKVSFSSFYHSIFSNGGSTSNNMTGIKVNKAFDTYFKVDNVYLGYDGMILFNNCESCVFDVGVSHDMYIGSRFGIANSNDCIINCVGVFKNKLEYTPSVNIANCSNIVVTNENFASKASDCIPVTFDSCNGILLYGIYKEKMDYLVKLYNGSLVSLEEDVEKNNFPLFVEKMQIVDKSGNEVDVLGKQEVTFRVYFNRDVITNENAKLKFGSAFPYNDYSINGSYIDDRTWEGTYTLKAFIENGFNTINVSDFKSNDLITPSIANNGLNVFEINTTAAMAMAIQANATTDGVNLTWVQDDYDTLMGYNIYRSDSKDGNYTKLNNVIIPSNENTFLDENSEPGKSYWYTFTVVLSDFSESAPAGKVFATMLDTEKPNLYHTPVNQGYLNNNLVIYCTASDNVGVTNVILYYRTKGDTAWKQLTMLKQNDKYSATIFGSELSIEGLEYYIVASDGVNTITKGNEESPYSVLIKDSSALAMYGDVDGDGIITTKDALMIIKAINGDLILTDDQFKRADLNKDNTLSSVEALRILQYINGNVITLEM